MANEKSRAAEAPKTREITARAPDDRVPAAIDALLAYYENAKPLASVEIVGRGFALTDLRRR